MIKGDVEVHYSFLLKNYKMTDVDNLIKPIQDIIVKNGLIEDDRKIKRIIAEKFQLGKKDENDMMVINIIPYK